MSAGRLLRTYISMPGSAVFTIISSVTRALVCASAGIENSIARKKPVAVIRNFNGASLVFFVFVVINVTEIAATSHPPSRGPQRTTASQRLDEAHIRRSKPIQALQLFPVSALTDAARMRVTRFNVLFTISVHNSLYSSKGPFHGSPRRKACRSQERKRIEL
jgi:hypothetical protein